MMMKTMSTRLRHLCYNSLMTLVATASFVAFGGIDSIIEHTVVVSPNKAKNKAFRMEAGSAVCYLYLTPESPWAIRDSRITGRDDKTLWKKFDKAHYFMVYGFAENEYVKIDGDLYRSGNGGGGTGTPEYPPFSVTVPKVDLQWDAKHGDASKEEKEDTVPAVLVVSNEGSDFGELIVKAPKDDFSMPSINPKVTLTWDKGKAVRVFDGESEVKSGVTFMLMWGTEKHLSVRAVAPADKVKFTLEGEPDVVNHDRAVDYVHACCAVPEVEKIMFNHAVNSLQDGAVEIRQSYGAEFTGIENGEWIRDINQNYPVCYVANTRARLKVAFVDKSKRVRSAKISAVVKDGAHIIKALKPKTVNFRNGKSVPETVEFEMDGALPSVVTVGNDTYQWLVEDVNGSGSDRHVMGKTGPHRTYVILGEPKLPWLNQRGSNQCPWTNALEFAIVRSGANGQGTESGALSAITTYLHSGHGLVYDTQDAAAHYCHLGSMTMDLTQYIRGNGVVNCVDQAAGLVSLSTLLGIGSCMWKTMPFGYINTVSLVGVGRCNNPLCGNSSWPETPICSEDSFSRRSLMMHMYVVYDELVWDSCIGPALGDKSRLRYLRSIIDASTDNEYQSSFFSARSSGNACSDGVVRLRSIK